MAEIYSLGHDTLESGIRLERYGAIAGESWYAVNAVLPHRQATDRPIVFTTALGTSVDGYNRQTQEDLARLGWPSICVGPEGSFHRRPINWRDMLHMSQQATAESFLRIVGKVASRVGADIHPVERVIIGESRGAMIGTIVTATAGDYDQHVAYADLTAPCFPREFRAPDVMRVARGAMSVPVELTRILGKTPLSRLVHWGGTLDLNLDAQLHQARLAMSLLSGECGEYVQDIDIDTVMHITTFNRDDWTMHDRWVELYAKHPNVRITALKGGHLSLADPETQLYLHARLSALLEQNIEKPLDTQKLWDRSHELVAETLNRAA